MAGINELNEFIAYAERNRKYAAETARGRRNALKLFVEVLNDDEMKSIDLVYDRFEQIYQSVFNKNKQKISAASLTNYRSRVLGLINDFKKYGADPNAFNAWDTTRKRAPSSRKSHKSPTSDTPRVRAQVLDAEVISEPKSDYIPENEIRSLSLGGGLYDTELNKIEFYLRPGFKISLMLPVDLNQKEAYRLKHMIDGMVSQDDQGGL